MSELHKRKVAIFASGSGSTAEAFIHATQQPGFNAEVGLIVSDKAPDRASIFQRTRRLKQQYGLDIQTRSIEKQCHPALPGQKIRGLTPRQSATMREAVDRSGCDLVLLMGFMQVVNGELLDAYGWRPSFVTPYQGHMLNTHPGPLPETADTYGLRASQRVINLGMESSKHTLHLVAAGVDTGPIIAEHAVPRRPGRAGNDASILFEDVQVVEKAHIAADTANFIDEQNAYFARIAEYSEMLIEQ